MLLYVYRRITSANDDDDDDDDEMRSTKCQCSFGRVPRMVLNVKVSHTLVEYSHKELYLQQ